jgi:acyl-homoserine lactone acylase PvdQ
MSRVFLRALVAACSLVLVPAAALADDFAGTALNIIPSGQYGGIPVPTGADEQAKMYDSLTPLFDQVTAPDLLTAFKSERFGVDTAGPGRRETVPRAGVTIVRDHFNVPHIPGKTRDDVTWATGWVLEEDRALLLAQGRYPARLAAVDAPNIDAFGLVTGLKVYTPTRAVDRTILRNGLRALRSAPNGKALLHDVDVYVQGLNARLRAEKSAAKPFTRVDVFAVNALVGQIFGQGGGGEAQRSQLLSGLRKRLGAGRAQSLFDDLTEHDDADAQATLTKRTPYEAIPKKAPGSVALDDGSFKPQTFGKASAGAAAAGATQHRWASNFLIVGRQRSVDGHPLFVGGPQIGYFYPGLTLEADISGPGFQARGATAPGFPGNILIGRGPDFVWSLTSAGSDLIDHYVETLCGGSRTRYRYKGRCRSMGKVDAGVIKGTGRVRYRTTVHGPVIGYGKVDGKTVAVSRKRASFGEDILFQLPFREMTLNKVNSAASFFKAMGESPFTFNAGYADDRDIAMFSAGKLPLRDKRVDPRLPTKGTGQYEWKGFLAPGKHPQQVDPPTGLIVNWNNRPAPGWGAADDNWSYGSSHRVRLLTDGLAKRPQHDLASVTSAMNAAATQDLRNVQLTPTLSALLAGVPAPSPRAQSMLDLLEAWRAAGSSRLDRDLDGVMDAGPGPAIIDALYPRLYDAVMRPALGAQLDALESFEGSTAGPGSGFTGGGLWYMDKDLRTLTGQQFRDPYATHFCGGGDRAQCAAIVWAAIESAGNDLAAKQGPDPTAWRADANAERIKFVPGVLPTTIRYTNRPSGIQQVIEFTGHRKR